MRVLVVEHEADAGLGLIGERLHAAGVDVRTVGPDAGPEVPDSLAGVDGLIVLGGSTGPLDDDRAPHLASTRRLMRAALDEGLPLLGVCLGAQMLAVVAGGEVARAAGGGEVGVSALHATDAAASDPLLHDLPPDLRAMQWHFLEVTGLPSGSISLCASERCANQAFRVGQTAWGLQFHLEATPQTAVDWTAAGEEDLAAVGLSASDVVAQAAAADAELRRTWSVVADRWIEVVRRRTAPRDGHAADDVARAAVHP